MAILSRFKRNKFQNGIVNLVGKIAQDPSVNIESDRRVFNSDGIISDRRKGIKGGWKTMGERSLVITSGDNKIEILQNFSRVTGRGTHGLYALVINGKKQEIPQDKLEKLYKLVEEQKMGGKKSAQNQAEIAALLQKYVHE